MSERPLKASPHPSRTASGGALAGARPGLRARGVALACALACGAAAPTFAQQVTRGQSLTLEELEVYIEEQKAALARAESNRRITREKEAKVREELARREARRQALEEEMRGLCEERLAVGAADLPAECEAGSDG